MKKSIQDQIKDLEATRAAKIAALQNIHQKAIDEGRSLDETEGTQADELEADVKQIDGDLKRLNSFSALVTTAKEVKEDGKEVARTPRISIVEQKRDPGLNFARFAGVIAAAKGAPSEALRFAKHRFKDDAMLHKSLELYANLGPEQFAKATVDVGTTTDSDFAAPLVYATQMASEFIDYLRPQTILGRVPGLRRVPFNIRVPRMTAGGTSGWVGEAKPKPLTQQAFDYVTLAYKKNAVISVISQELARFSNPSAEMLIRDDLASAIIEGVDADFVDPDNAGTANVKPASITYGVTPAVSNGGTSEANIRTDVNTMLAEFVTNNKGPQRGVWIIPTVTAMRLSTMVTTLGVPAFPGISAEGGTFFGLPVVTSQSSGLLNSSANGKIVILVNAPEILVADDGQVSIDVSDQASVQMESSPTDPVVAATVLISLWQQNLLGIKAERFIDWTKARSTSVTWANSVNWGE